MGRHQSVVWSLISIVESVPNNRRLLTRLENRLHGVHALMESVADLTDPQLPDIPLAQEFEELVSSAEIMLDHFERIVKAFATPAHYAVDCASVRYPDDDHRPLAVNDPALRILAVRGATRLDHTARTVEVFVER